MEYFDGKGDGDFNTLRLIVEGRPSKTPVVFAS